MLEEKGEIANKRLPSSHVRFTEIEFKRIQKMNQVTGLSFPELLKKALFDRMDLEQPLFSPEDAHTIKVELNRQGNNINQLTKYVNEGGRIGWNQSFNNFTRSYVDLRHLILGKHASR